MAKKQRGRRTAEDRLLVMFKNDVGEDRIDELLKALGVEEVTILETVLRDEAGREALADVHLLQITDGVSVKAKVLAFTKLPEVEFAAPMPMRKLIKPIK